MKAVMLMFDSLNRHLLSPYGCDWTHTPNFDRLAERCVTFDTSYVCSMPCMPARRDFHTARPNFLHRRWGPLEPFDDSVPQMLQDAGVETALISDHYHYWEDGGANYHCRYGTWQHFRGQEGDPWIGQVRHVPAGDDAYGVNALEIRRLHRDRLNRRQMPTVAEHHQTRTLDAGIEFIDRNHADDRWFVQIECFDPHEPFFVHDDFRAAYEKHYANWKGPDPWDWPAYGPVQEPPEYVEHMRHQYASLLAMCDFSVGRVMDAMDRHGLWDDTMLIVWTDHGLCLGEHDAWLKNWMPLYDTIANTPFFLWDPRSGKKNQRRAALVQPSLDLGPTLLSFFGVEPTPDMLGHDLSPVLKDDTPVRDAAIFGYHGRVVNVTDGRYVYMRGILDDRNRPLFNYTLMPANMADRVGTHELQADCVETVGPLSFSKGCAVMKIGPPADRQDNRVPADQKPLMQTALYDTHRYPDQSAPVTDAEVEARMTEVLLAEMQRCDAPPEQYERLGLTAAAT